MGRSVRKILSLPLFSDEFCLWLVHLHMTQFEKLSAVSDGFAAECVESFVTPVPALADLPMLAAKKLLFILVKSMASIGCAGLTVDLGFGLVDSSLASGRSPLKQKAAGDPQLVPVPRQEQFSLKAQEAGEARIRPSSTN